MRIFAVFSFVLLSEFCKFPPDPIPTVEPTLAMGVNTVLMFLFATTKCGADAFRGIFDGDNSADLIFFPSIASVSDSVLVLPLLFTESFDDLKSFWAALGAAPCSVMVGSGNLAWDGLWVSVNC